MESGTIQDLGFVPSASINKSNNLSSFSLDRSSNIDISIIDNNNYSNGGHHQTLHAYNGPVYVNARQYARILKRREAKFMIEAKMKMNHPRKRYLHESRHNHACKRPRGTGGRFLTKAEIDALQAKQQSQQSSNQFSDHPEAQTSESGSESGDMISSSTGLMNSVHTPSIDSQGEHYHEEESKFE